ncbi:MAG: hypothetical protein N3G21_05555 [Candidatus Hydrogenedentes bacterium]|nr:hypothetical protein [Candidatus Hydrogenedentota bacterium]
MSRKFSSSNIKGRLIFSLFLILITLLLVQNDSFGASKKKKRVEEEVPSPRMSPWSLRHRYTYSWEDMGIDFDEFNGDWRIFATTPGSYVENTLVEGYGPTIYLESGEVIEAYQIGNATTDREAIESVFGKGTNFTAIFPPKNGIVVKQRVTTFSKYSFVVFTTSVVNNRTEPLSISKVKVMGFPSVGGNLQRNISKLNLIPVENIAGYWSYTSKDRSQVVEFSSLDGIKHAVFAIASQGKPKSRVVFLGDSLEGEGGVECEYVPPVLLRPGEYLESDPVVVSFSNYYGKLLSNVCWGVSSISPLINKNSFSEVTRGWILVPSEKATQVNLQRVSEFSSNVGLNSVYIPKGWENPIGSCKADMKKFNSNMKLLIDTLRVAKGIKVGLFLDPWVVPSDSGFSINTPDGYAVANYTLPEGIKVAEERWKKIREWRIDYIVCGVNVPQNILRELNSTNEEALAIGIKELSRFFDKIPVYPSFSDNAITSKEAFFEYTNFISHCYEAGGGVAPSTIDNTFLTNSDELVKLILSSKPYKWIWVGDFNKNEVRVGLEAIGKSNEYVVSALCKFGGEINTWRVKKHGAPEAPVPIQLLYILPSVSKLGDSLILGSIDSENTKLCNLAEGRLVEKFSDINFDNLSYFMVGVVKEAQVPYVVGIKGRKLGGAEDIKSVNWISDGKKLFLNLNSHFDGSEELILYVPSNLKVMKVFLDKRVSNDFIPNGELVSVKLKSNLENVEVLFD